MAKITLNQPAGGYNLSAINANFQTLQDLLNNQVLFRQNVVGEPNQMGNDLDMNGFRILNYTLVLPTSAANLPSGAIWNNNGIVAIVP